MAETIVLTKDAAALALKGAEIISKAASSAIAARGRFSIAMSGGSTPKDTLAILAGPNFRDKVDWSLVDIYMGDDRYIDYDNTWSNFGMVKAALLDHVPIPSTNIFPIDTSIQPIQKAALAYEALLRERLGDPPIFDLALQGMGDDGHTASLFPHSVTLDSTDRVVVDSAPGILPPPVDRITITLPVIRAARIVLFMIAGTKKAGALADILEGGASVADHPTQGTRGRDGQFIWLIDESAAAKLKDKN
jgi:6-phosphogluconolactonase